LRHFRAFAWNNAGPVSLVFHQPGLPELAMRR